MRGHRLWVVAACLAACTSDGSDGAKSDTNGTFGTAVAGADRIVLNTEYGLGVGGSLVVEFRPYLRFSDGDLYRNLGGDPTKLDRAASKRAEPNEWGTWRRQGAALVVRWSDGEEDTWDEGTWYEARPAPPGFVLAGSFTSLSGGGNTALGGDVITFSQDTLSFEGERFTFESVGGGSNASVTAYASATKAGTYVLSGHTMTLRFNDGREQVRFFYLFPDSSEVFGLGEATYTSNR